MMRCGDGEPLIGKYGPRDLRLGWLKSFVIVARHGDYVSAASDLDIELKQVKTNVANLELWLHKILIDDWGALQLTDDGQLFLPIARWALEVMREQFDSVAGINRPRSLRPAIHTIWLSELAAVHAIALRGNYKAAAYELGCSSSQVRRKIAKLEGALGLIVAGRTEISLTPFGHGFADLCHSIVFEVTKGRAIIPAPYDPDVERMRRVKNDLTRIKGTFEIYSTIRAGQGKFSKIDRVQAASAERSLAHVEALLHALPDLPRYANEMVDPKTIEIAATKAV